MRKLLATDTNSGPTFKTLPERGVEHGLRTSNSLRPQTTLPTICALTHHHATHLAEPYLIATKSIKALELWKAKLDLPGISQPGKRTYVAGAVACSTTTTTEPEWRDDDGFITQYTDDLEHRAAHIHSPQKSSIYTLRLMY